MSELDFVSWLSQKFPALIILMQIYKQNIKQNIDQDIYIFFIEKRGGGDESQNIRLVNLKPSSYFGVAFFSLKHSYSKKLTRHQERLQSDVVIGIYYYCISRAYGKGAYGEGFPFCLEVHRLTPFFFQESYFGLEVIMHGEIFRQISRK